MGVYPSSCWDTAPPPGTVHAGISPPGIRSMSGRYTSYWNAFLLLKLLIMLTTHLCIPFEHIMHANDTPLPEQTLPGTRHPPPEQTLPGSRHPLSRHSLGRHPSREQTPPPLGRLQYMVYEHPLRILLECILVFMNFPPKLHIMFEITEN